MVYGHASRCYRFATHASAGGEDPSGRFAGMLLDDALIDNVPNHAY